MSICLETDLYFANFSNYPFHSVGLLLDILSIVGICFAFDLKMNLFKYLLAKSISDALNNITSIVTDIYHIYYDLKYFSLTRLACIIYVDVLYFLNYVAPTLSPFFEVAASFERYKMISSNFKFMDKVNKYF